MDFHSMKRKDLQRLCKEHGIKANLKNVEMADSLSSLFKEEKPTKRGSSCLKSDEEELVSNKESKRVKFCLENETFWFEKTDPREMRLMARKKRGFQNLEIEQNPVSLVEEIVQNDGNLEKTFERKLRRRSVVVKCDPISESKSVDDHVEKPVTFERKLRRRSVVVKCDQIPGSKSVDDHVEKPVTFERKLRRRSVVAKCARISESKSVDDHVEKQPVRRSSRRKSLIVESDEISEPKTVDDDHFEKPVSRNMRRKSVVVESDHISESKMNEEKVEKPVQRTRRKSVAVKSGPSLDLEIVVDKVEKPVQRASRRNSVVVKSDQTFDSKHVVDKLEKPAERASRRRSVVKSDQKLDSKIAEVKRASRSSFVESDQNVNSNIAVESNVQEKSSEIAPDIKKGKRRTTKITRKQGVKRGRKVVAEDLMEENVDVIIDKTHDDAVADVQTLSNVSSMLQNCGDGEAESSMQANKVDESSSLNIVLDKNSYEEDASAPPSLLRIQFSDTLVGSIAEHNFVGELMCRSTTRPSLLGSCAVGDAGEKQPSGSLDEIRSAMRDGETFQSIDGLQCHQSRNEQLVQQESWFEKSPCLGSSPKNENAVEDKRIDCAAVIVEGSDVQTTEQDEATGLWGSCESIVREVDQTCEFSVDQQPSHFTSEEKVVLVPEANMETKVQTPVVVEGVILSPNASGSTRNKVMEEGKDINTITLLWNQDIVSRSSDAEDSPVVQSLNKNESVVGSPKSKASECVSVAGETKYLEQSSVDAAEDMKCNVSCSNNNANFGNFKDRGTPEVSHPVNRLLHLDVGNTRIEPPEHNNPAEETITSTNKLDIHLKDDDQFPGLKFIPQKDIIHRLETLCDNYFAQSCELTVPSGSVAEERYKGTPSTDLTCFANDGNGEYIDEKAKYITAKQPEEANCFDKPEFQHMVSGDDKDDITNDAQSEDLEAKRVTWTTEDLLAKQPEEANCFDDPEFQHMVSGDDKDDMTNDAQSEDLEAKRVTWTTEDLLALGGEVDESVMFQERKPADLESERNESNHTKDFELKIVKNDDEIDDHDANNHGEDSVIMLQVQDGELAETSDLENATSSGGFVTSSNAVSENSPIKETVDPVSELVVHFKHDETSPDLKSNSCNIPVELMEIQTPKVLHAQDSSPDASQEKTNLKIEIDNIAAQESKFVDSIEDKVKSRAQETGYFEEAEGVGTWGNGSPESTIGNMLDEAPGQGFSRQAKSVGSVKKEFVFISQQAGYVEGATEAVNIAENESSKSNSEREVGEEFEIELAMQNNMLINVSKSSKRDGGDEIVEECSMVATGLEHSVGQGKHADSCGSPFEMADKSGSPMRNSGNFSLREVASGSDNDAGSLMVDYPTSMDSYSADVYAPTCEISSESLQTSQVNLYNKTLQNACIGDVDGLLSGEPIPFENNQDNKAEMVEPEAKTSNATPPGSAVLDNMISVALVSEIHDGPECIVRQDLFDYANTREMELQGLTSSPFSTVNWKAKGNYETNIAQPRDNVCSAMVESHSFGENEKEASDIEGALEYDPEEHIGNHLYAESRTRQENVIEEQEEDACTNVNDNLATSRPEDLLRCDIGEVSDVKTNIVHEKIHSESELDLTANDGNCMSEEQVINQEHMDPVHTDASMIEKDHLAVDCSCSLEISPEHIAHCESRSPACNDYAQELDFAKSPDVGLSQDNRRYSVEKEAHIELVASPFINAASESLIPTHDVLERTISQASVSASGAHEMTQEYLSGCPFTLFQQEKDSVCCIGNSEANVDDDVTALSNSMEKYGKLAEKHFSGPSERRIGRETSDIDTSDNIADTDISPPFIRQPGKFITALLESDGLKSNVVFTDSEVDYLCCGEWETAKVEVRELQSGTSNVACSVNEYEIPDVEPDTVSTPQPADEMILEPENLASVEQEQLGNSESEARGYVEVLMSSVIQQKNIKNYAENEDMKSNIVFTDSEIELLLGETTEKDEVRELQTEASDDTCPVNEYDSADVENDNVSTHLPAVEKILEPQNLASEEQKPGDDEKEKSHVSVDLVRDVQNCIDDKVIQIKNERSILIHATPKKLPIFMNDMKENTPALKRQQMVDVTAAKPSLRRKALQKID